MTILRVDDETFSIIMMALHECGYDVEDLEISMYDEVEVKDEIKVDSPKNLKKDRKNKICID